MTFKNQITLPQAVARRFPGVDFFDVREEDGRIVLEPLRPGRAGESTPVVSGATVTELVRVLTYPKFGLAAADREELLCNVLPYAELFDGDPAGAPIEAADAAGQPFVDLVLACGAAALVTSDAALLALAPRVPVIRPGDLRSRERRPGEEPRAG